MKNSPIGIFDSGIGGLTIAQSIKELLPNESIIYFGDTKHLPYGEKSAKAIQEFSKNISDFLKKKNCKAIVIACNSASSVAFDIVKENTNNIEVFNVIDPVVDYVNENCNNCNVGVIGTKATISSDIYSEKILQKNKNQTVNSLATPLLAPMIEEGFINEEISKTIIQNYLNNPTLKDINSLILACTHYPLIQKEIEEFYNNEINVIDSANIIAKHIKTKLNHLDLLSDTDNSENQFFVSNYTKSFEKSAKFFSQEEIKLTEINLHQ